MDQLSEPPLVDTGNAPEIFCSRLVRVTSLNMNACFTFALDRIGPNGHPERSVNLNLYFPVEAVGPAIELTLARLKSGLIVPVTRYVAGRLFH